MIYLMVGMIVGLFGGLFDLLYVGYVYIICEVFKWFGLDWVWWLVSPGNFLKECGLVVMECWMVVVWVIMWYLCVMISDFEVCSGMMYMVEMLVVL